MVGEGQDGRVCEGQDGRVWEMVKYLEERKHRMKGKESSISGGFEKTGDRETASEAGGNEEGKQKLGNNFELKRTWKKYGISRTMKGERQIKRRGGQVGYNVGHFPKLRTILSPGIV